MTETGCKQVRNKMACEESWKKIRLKKIDREKDKSKTDTLLPHKKYV